MRSLARVGVSSLARVPRPPAVRTSLRFLSAELPPSVRLALQRTVRFRRTAVELANRLEEADELSDELREELMQVILWQRCTRISKVSVLRLAGNDRRWNSLSRRRGDGSGASSRPRGKITRCRLGRRDRGRGRSV